MATLAYASPEQLRGEPASTLSDIFSLGVVLYELMTGQRPFGDDLTARLAPAHTDGLALPQPLSGDLDAIVRKALATAPSERYQSVEQLAEDIRRYRSGEADRLIRPPSEIPPAGLPVVVLAFRVHRCCSCDCPRHHRQRGRSASRRR